ncbi:MAG: hypothetical protein CMH63_01030 [Nanoarchaeota archaeon]|jgi:membrane-bound metal-dependent hydrolase YbcI (DUF457 family)|nr:hypothetical protein [Nanoarchaeota archaeon]|tara:strand:- start:6971 stop:7486 length:516 start_codon:yes stop_codon:yes gene_type:complete
MPLAVTHILIPLVLAGIYRDYFAKKKFSIRYVFVAGLAGLFPDLDILVGWIFNLFSYIPISDIHRTLTHSLAFPLLFLILFYLTKNYTSKYFKKQNIKISYLFLAISFGSLTHILLDAFLSGPVQILPGFMLGIGMNFSYFQGTFFQGLDAILLVLWLVHEEYKHHISDYI